MAHGTRARIANRLPTFVRDLGADRDALWVLIAGSAALFAAGADPKVHGAGMPTSQAALRLRPEIEGLFLITVVIVAGFYLVGGAIGDLVGRRRVLLVGLSGLAAAEAVMTIWGQTDVGLVFVASRVLAAASVGLVIPVAIASVAVAYRGVNRATALGVAYAVYGGATALTPALLLAVLPKVGTWPSFLLATIMALVALRIAWRRVPVTPPGGLKRVDVVGHATWAFGLLAVTAGVVGVSGGVFDPIRIALVGGGMAILAIFVVWQRRRPSTGVDAAIDVRPVTIALFAGVVIALAQAAPALQAPLYFQIVAGFGPLAATAAIAPFVLALIVAGPVAGALLGRYSPRVLIAGGLAAVGLGDLAFGLVGVDTPYLFFIVPFIAIGAGFVVGTTVRTAVIFASVPRRLPATAAALNETSLLIGSQIGVVIVTSLVGEVALRTFTESTADMSSGDAAAAIAAFNDFMRAIGTAAFGPLIQDLPAQTTVLYGAAYAAGVSTSLTIVGAISALAAVAAWFGMGKHAKVESVWEHRDERAGGPGPAGPGPGSSPATVEPSA